MPDYFNDSPIESREDDRYGVSPFAESIAKSILRIKQPIGTTIALHGPWGSGKSSIVNLIRAALDEAGEKSLVITDFRCWWYRGEEALALAFLQNLNVVLKEGLGDKVKDLVPNMTRLLLQAGPVIGTAVSLASGAPLANLIPGVSDFARRFFPEGTTVEKTFQQLTKTLADGDRRFLVIIDDIDRLDPDEALAVFRLLKSVGHLPNVIYLVVFDRDLAEKEVALRYPSEGPHFLEKIIQAGFEVPSPLQVDLNEAVLSSVERICGTPDEGHIRRLMNVFYDAVAPYITTPRHVARFENAVTVTWPAIADEVSLADFIALEAIRLYEPALYKAIRSKKTKVCGTGRDDSNSNGDARFDEFLKEVPEERHETATAALMRLFPRLESMGYTDDWVEQWSLERRVCVEKHFDTYFRMSLSEEVLPTKLIDDLVERADDREFVLATFRAAAQTERKRGTSMVPVYLDELTTHATRIEKAKIESFLKSLFEIHDEIDLKKDAERGLMRFGSTTLRFHWLIRRLTRGRFSLAERTDLYLSATQTAALGWLVDFAISAKDDYSERENGPRREDDILVGEEAVPRLVERALVAIREAAANGTLLQHKDLGYILYRWRDFLDGDVSEVRAWTDGMMGNDGALIVFARMMTGAIVVNGHGGIWKPWRQNLYADNDCANR